MNRGGHRKTERITYGQALPSETVQMNVHIDEEAKGLATLRSLALASLPAKQCACCGVTPPGMPTQDGGSKR